MSSQEPGSSDRGSSKRMSKGPHRRAKEQNPGQNQSADQPGPGAMNGQQCPAPPNNNQPMNANTLEANLERANNVAQEGKQRLGQAHQEVFCTIDDLLLNSKNLTEALQTLHSHQGDLQDANFNLNALLDELVKLCQEYVKELFNKEANLKHQDLAATINQIVQHLKSQNKGLTDQISALANVADELAKKQADLDRLKDMYDAKIADLEKKLADEEKFVHDWRQRAGDLADYLKKLEEKDNKDKANREAEMAELYKMLEALKKELAEAKQNAIEAENRYQELLRQLQQKLAEKEQRVEALQNQLNDVARENEQLQGTVKEVTTQLESAKLERAQIVAVIRNALATLPLDRIGLPRDIGDNDPIPPFLQLMCKVLGEELQKAWAICNQLESTNNQLQAEIEQEQVKRAHMDDAMAKKYENYAKQVRDEANDALKIVRDLKTKLDKANKEKVQLKKQAAKDAEKYEALLNAVDENYVADKAKWDELRKMLEKELEALRQELMQCQNDGKDLRKKCAEIAAADKEKEKMLQKLRADADQLKHQMSGQISDLERELRAAKEQLQAEREEMKAKEQDLKNQITNIDQKYLMLLRQLSALEKEKDDLAERLCKAAQSAQDEKKRADALDAEKQNLDSKCQRIWQDKEKVAADWALLKVQLEKEQSANDDLRKKLRELEDKPVPEKTCSPSPTKPSDVSAQQCEAELRERTVALEQAQSKLGDAAGRERDLKANLDNKNAENERQARELNDLRNQVKTLGDEVFRGNNECKGLANELEGKDKELAEARDEADKLRKRVADLENFLNQQKAKEDPQGGGGVTQEADWNTLPSARARKQLNKAGGPRSASMEPKQRGRLDGTSSYGSARSKSTSSMRSEADDMKSTIKEMEAEMALVQDLLQRINAETGGQNANLVKSEASMKQIQDRLNELKKRVIERAEKEGLAPEEKDKLLESIQEGLNGVGSTLERISKLKAEGIDPESESTQSAPTNAQAVYAQAPQAAPSNAQAAYAQAPQTAPTNDQAVSAYAPQTAPSNARAVSNAPQTAPPSASPVTTSVSVVTKTRSKTNLTSSETKLRKTTR